jgi:CDP-glycerol glycerophosphotransferase
MELVLFSVANNTQHPFDLHRQEDGRFAAVATPAATTTLAGDLPLPEGRWRLCVRRSGRRAPAALTALVPSPEMEERLPLETVIGHKRFTLGLAADGGAVLAVDRDLDDDERGPFQQRQLRRTAYAPRRSEPLTETAVFTSFRGRQYSDSPRAIHEELVRRDAPLEHFWVVRDGACRVPPTATVLRDGSREHYEVMARARYVVTNDHFPEWFERRQDQLCVQTWHGTPLKRLGFDVSALRDTMRKFEHGWATQVHNWQYVVSPNRFATPILERAYMLEGARMLETGYPRDDMLAGPDRDEVTRRVRAHLGLPEGARTVLYLPTFRDHVKDRRGRYRLDLQLDIERLRGVLGPDTVLLVRKHHYIVDQIPVTPDGFVRDVSSYPDGNELLLAADVLLTDYSSAMVDFANTGRPMLFFAYDLDTYRDEIRGFYVDYEATVPGPVLTTSDQVAEALSDLGAVEAAHADRYAAFTAKFCELDDGGATGRVVDEVFAR